MIPVESPCFRCVGKKGEPSPCCWYIDVYVSSTDQTNTSRFREYGVAETPAYFHKPDRHILTGSRFHVQGPCPMLDVSSGECSVEEDKPYNCRHVVPLRDIDCTDRRC